MAVSFRDRISILITEDILIIIVGRGEPKIVRES